MKYKDDFEDADCISENFQHQVFLATAFVYQHFYEMDVVPAIFVYAHGVQCLIGFQRIMIESAICHGFYN